MGGVSLETTSGWVGREARLAQYRAQAQLGQNADARSRLSRPSPRGSLGMNMFLRSTILAAAVLATGSCELASDLLGSRHAEAHFRFVARRTYGWLFQPSCQSPPGFSRVGMLSDEIQAVRAFEQSLSGGPGSVHIQIAKSDAELTESCWEDADLAFAQIHVTMTREQVSRGLEQMRQLAPRLRNLPLTLASASEGAEFRLRTRRLIESIHPLCTTAFDDQIFAPARERVRRFASELTGSEFAAHFDVAKRDIEFEQSRVVVECPATPTELDLAAARRDALADVENQISELESIIRPSAGLPSLAVE